MFKKELKTHNYQERTGFAPRRLGKLVKLLKIKLGCN